MTTDSTARDWWASEVRDLASLLAVRWLLPTIEALRAGSLRRNALKSVLGQISDKVLTETLHRMVEEGLLDRVTIPSVPVEVDYGLTPKALSLWPLLCSMQQWSDEHMRQI